MNGKQPGEGDKDTGEKQEEKFHAAKVEKKMSYDNQKSSWGNQLLGEITVLFCVSAKGEGRRF